ncbi:hypothetical protein P0E69_22865 (plasmid) [Chimaeribacter arupi]|uniref:hypothetical protein n=1 Tax=Chimaeribacter arupi TaxID=2060066 RepID=UPI00271208BD|nr:hypothetical protein [Chimaeribacter arupi]WKZ94807.1 hypothetical protein P0E69_22865 [Chimaeribacter arupi]
MPNEYSFSTKNTRKRRDFDAFLILTEKNGDNTMPGRMKRGKETSPQGQKKVRFAGITAGLAAPERHPFLHFISMAIFKCSPLNITLP